MSGKRSQNYRRLGIIAGSVLLILGMGYFTGRLATVLEVLEAIGLFLICITILVTVHELGHFLTAKMFGIRVEKFSIGFPPKILSFQKGETEYQIGAVPLGGYVKIVGMIDESLDRETINRERAREQGEQTASTSKAPDWAPKPWEFRAKPVWQRLIVMTGGVIMNVILGIAIFSSVKYIYGEDRIPMSEAENGIVMLLEDNSLGGIIGFQSGDKLVSFKGESFPYFNDYLRTGLLLEDEAYFEVMRDDQLVRLNVPGNIQNYFSEDSIENYLFNFFPDIRAQLIVGDSMAFKNAEGVKEMFVTPASEAGLQTGDVVIRIDSTPINVFSELRTVVSSHPGPSTQVTYVRAGDTLQTEVVLFRRNGRNILGVEPDSRGVISLERKDFGLWEAIVAGSRQAFGIVGLNIRGFSNATRSDVSFSKSVMGPLRIGEALFERYQEEGIFALISMTGILSMVLAFVNILPIPALDGGHVLFLLIEGITRREPSVKIRLMAQQFGMIFILGLMIFIFANDIINF
ncbi:MAG: RIP metalloprotease RseP [Bacteroidota bacterium]